MRRGGAPIGAGGEWRVCVSFTDALVIIISIIITGMLCTRTGGLRILDGISDSKNLLSDKFDGIFIFHAELDQSQSHQHRRPTHK